ncbi:D-alanine--D-alanine ligase family protein [Endothiovibrio diazotrophicus]
MALRIGVFFGGRTAEHEISIISAQQAIAMLRESYTVVPLYLSKGGAWYTGEALLDIANFKDLPALLRRCTEVIPSLNPARPVLMAAKPGLFGSLFGSGVAAEIDVAFPVMHGVHGEDGTLQGVFEMADLPYVGSSTAASAAGMDKVTAKSLFQAAGLPVLDSVWFYGAQWLDDADGLIERMEAQLGYPMVVKPADLGSSIGVGKAGDREALREAVDLALEFTAKVLVEPAVEPLREINCALLGDRDGVETSVCEEPLSADAILSFQDKYMSGGGKGAAKGGGGKGASGAKGGGMASLKRVVPAEIPAELEAEIKRLAVAAFRALDCAGVARVDFLLDQHGQPYANEINTIPGSLSFYLWEHAGKSFAQLLDEMIQLALKRHREKGRLQFSQETNVLDGFTGSGAKGAKG